MGKSPMCDYHVVATVISPPQAKAIIDALTRLGKNLDLPTRRVEGDFTSRWVLIDFGDIIVHLMHREERMFYNLEDIWLKEVQ
ncbi:MAG TPA: ribosome silencing factor [Caldisericia bacterium]|nr:ribosome silencing factor [Caldisericia bacterium]HPF48096.1 ribosome silencing factor [Caldisericia bacterium]HPI83967.1 ribosome silencing factor [Caldisericia bacterium]HPQ92549.1 ribosome silencing factor [Caldisericia bacterium]HRV74353.1 ribosome silencing factor [Caldisericia bacterium]